MMMVAREGHREVLLPPIGPGQALIFSLVRSRGFSLLELLVVIGVIALLVGILVPTLAASRDAARTAGCASNLRQIQLICRAYADQFKGSGPALGVPYASIPNWALQVQQDAGTNASGSASYTPASVLVCPAVRTLNARTMTRTYAINATGLSGQPGDRANYDLAQTHVRMDLIASPADAIAFIDSGVATTATNAAPPDRTASVLDFRLADHRAQRIARPHDRGRALNAVFFDGSARLLKQQSPTWLTPLP
jgi:prepilin-type N-terminal cleavage/methylation domain-containing protein